MTLTASILLVVKTKEPVYKLAFLFINLNTLYDWVSSRALLSVARSRGFSIRATNTTLFHWRQLFGV
jgi:hypothetical protein